MMDELVRWLREQLDDDERVARESKGSFWYTDGHSDEANAFMDRFDEGYVLALTAALGSIIESFCWEAQETRAIQVLAEALYADRAGYQESWRP